MYLKIFGFYQYKKFKGKINKLFKYQNSSHSFL